MRGVVIADSELTEPQLKEAKRLTDDILKLGFALAPVLPREQVEAELATVMRETWNRVCRGDERLEKAYPKFVMAVEDLLEPLFAASQAVERITAG